jgi:hypothetical protein
MRNHVRGCRYPVNLPSVPVNDRLRRRRGLVSVFAPVVIGIGVAFAWNGAASLQANQSEGMTGVAPQVGVTVQQAAVQTWVSAVTTTQAAGTDARASGTRHVVDLAHNTRWVEHR